jgi:ActR/RegA family two-component response regulator
MKTTTFDGVTAALTEASKRAAEQMRTDVEIAHVILRDVHRDLAKDATSVVALARELGEERRRRQRRGEGTLDD